MRTITPVIDLFAGPGGLGEGFSRYPEYGSTNFEIKLSIEMEKSAHQTLRLRSFFRQFHKNGQEIPEDYYCFIRGEISQQELFDRYQYEFEAADLEAKQAILGESDPDQIDKWIQDALGEAEDWVLLGGPPCQAYSLAGRSRNKGIKGYSLEKDEKSDLYKEYLRIIGNHWPAVFVMENVKGLLSAQIKSQKILHHILEDLSDPAAALNQGKSCKSYTYKIHSLAQESVYGEEGNLHKDFIIKSEKYGVPQARHRLILLGVRNDFSDIRPSVLNESDEFATVSKVLSGLPALRSGLSRENDSDENWSKRLADGERSRWLKGAKKAGGERVQSLMSKILSHIQAPKQGRGSEFVSNKDLDIKTMADWFIDSRIKGICNHSTRAHITKDLYRYLYASCYAKIHSRSPKLGEFPPDLLPKHNNAIRALSSSLFSDRFRVQVADKPSSTVTSHISKDGHYFIHYDPEQCRSLTVREAARLQTFPDNYFFCGGRTAQYTQVGNAVPPYLAWQIAEIVNGILNQREALK